MRSTITEAAQRRKKPSPPGGNMIFNCSVYYTAVEAYHTASAPTLVSGHLGDKGNTFGKKIPLGRLPLSFIRKVKAEGTGRLISPLFDRSYLNWSENEGYWLDTIPCHSWSWFDGTSLHQFQSCAADKDVLSRHTMFQVLSCGEDTENGDPPAKVMCDLMMKARWIIDDEFGSGLGGAQHIDLYIGEEDIPNFEKKSPKFVDLANVRIALL